MKYRPILRVSSIAIPVGFALLLGGCATVRPPTAEIAAADIAVRKAEKSGGGQYAALDMLRAREALQGAREKADDKDTYDAARRLADKSRVDAELAEAKSRSAMAEATADEAGKTLESLRLESEKGISD